MSMAIQGIGIGASTTTSMMAAKKSYEAMKKGITAAAAQAREGYEQYRTDVAPWREAGSESINQLWEMVQAGPGEYKPSEYYQNLLKTGTEALERGAAARGKQFSGQQAKALTEFGEQVGSAGYENWLNQWYQSLVPYQNVANMGWPAAQGSGEQAVNLANTLGNLSIMKASAKVAKIQGQAQAINSGIQSTSNMLSSSMGSMGSMGGGGGGGMGF